MYLHPCQSGNMVSISELSVANELLISSSAVSESIVWEPLYACSMDWIIDSFGSLKGRSLPCTVENYLQLLSDMRF